MKRLPVRCDGGCTGLTLIELLVTVSILTVIVSTILVALYTGILVWEKAGGYDARRMEAMLALEGFEQEVRNSIPFYGIEFQGDSTSVKFAGVLSESSDRDCALRFCEIEYAFDSRTRIFRRRSRTYPIGNAAENPFENAVSAVESVKIAYADVPARRDDPPVWLSSWTKLRRLPAALRVELEFRQGNGAARITRTIVLPLRDPEEKMAGGGADDAA